MTQDFFVCKDLKKGKWIERTDTFSPDDETLVVVAQIDPAYLNTRIHFELTSPYNKIVTREYVDWKRKRDIGYRFDIPELVDLGGYGEWQVLFFSDGLHIGITNFTLVEPEEAYSNEEDVTVDEPLRWEDATFTDIQSSTGEVISATE